MFRLRQLPKGLSEAGPDIIIGLNSRGGIIQSGNIQVYAWDSNLSDYRQIGLLKKVSLIADTKETPVKLEALFEKVSAGTLAKSVQVFQRILAKLGVKIKDRAKS